MSVNRNTVSILEALMRNEGVASVEELCGELQLTRQLLLYYVGSLNETLRASGVPTVSVNGDRLEVDAGGDAMLTALVEGIDRRDYVFVKEERRDLALVMAALRPSPVTIGQLGNFFSVSRSTVTSDIASLRELLARAGLELVSFSREGYRIEGDEWTLRWYVMDALSRSDSAVARRVSRGVLLGAAREAMGAGAEHGSQDLLEKMQRVLLRAVAEVETDSGTRLSYSMLGELPAYLVCVALRDHLRPDQAVRRTVALPIEETPEWHMADLVIRRLGELGLVVAPAEQAYVAALLRGSRVFSLDDPDNSRQPRALEFAELLVSEFERQMCTSFENRDELLRRLLPHVRAMLYRIAFSIRLPGSLARHVTDNYRQLYNATNLVCKTLEERLGIAFPPDEVAGLCVYFGSQDFGDHSAGDDLRSPGTMRSVLIVCGAGIGTSLMVCQQLRDLLGPGFTYESCSLRDYLERDVSSFDLVVSTVDSSLLPETVLRVSPSLTKTQERRLLDWSVRDSMERSAPSASDIMGIIERYVDDADALRLLGELSAYLGGGSTEPPRELHLLDILPASRIQVLDGASSQRDAIRLGCDPLVRDDIVTEGYADKILETIAELGLYAECREQILIAHAQPGVENLSVGMSLTVFRKPVSFEPWKRPFGVIFTLSATDQTAHVPAMRDLMALLSSDECCVALRSWSENTPEALYLYLAAQLSERGA